MAGWRPLAVLLILLATALAGCVGTPSSASVGAPESPDAGFALEVEVVTAEDQPAPVEGARVTVLNASAVTDGRGRAVFTVSWGASLTLHVQAPGRVDATSVPVIVPGGGATATDLAEGLTCVLSFGFACIDHPEVRLTGHRAALRMHLLPAEAWVTSEIAVAPGVGTDALGFAPRVGLPEPQWRAADVALAADPSAHMARLTQLASVEATLSWENGLDGAARYGLGLGCNEEEPLETAPPEMASVLPGPQEVALTWNEPPTAIGPDLHGWAAFGESKCLAIHAGPIVEPLTTGSDATLTLHLKFRPGTQWPIVLAAAS